MLEDKLYQDMEIAEVGTDICMFTAAGPDACFGRRVRHTLAQTSSDWGGGFDTTLA